MCAVSILQKQICSTCTDEKKTVQNKNNGFLTHKSSRMHLLSVGAERKVIIFHSNCVFLAVYVFIYSFQLKEKNKSQILIPGQVIYGVFQRIIGERQRAIEEGEAKGQKNEQAGGELIEISGDVSPCRGYFFRISSWRIGQRHFGAL